MIYFLLNIMTNIIILYFLFNYLQ